MTCNWELYMGASRSFAVRAILEFVRVSPIESPVSLSILPGESHLNCLFQRISTALAAFPLILAGAAAAQPSLPSAFAARTIHSPRRCRHLRPIRRPRPRRTPHSWLRRDQRLLGASRRRVG